MTVSTETDLVSYNGNGSTTVFTIPFPFAANADIEVILRDASGNETVLAITTHYTLAGAGAASGTCTMLIAPATGETLVISRAMTFTQETDYVPNDPFPADAHEAALDKTVMIDQELRNAQARTIKVSKTVTDAPDLELTELAADRAGKAVLFNAAGSAIALSDRPFVDTVPDAEAARDAAIVAQLAAEAAEAQALIYQNNAGVSATDAQLRAWESQAKRLTANSYAVEPASTFVKEYSSNGDGTFSYVNTTDYSALHYASLGPYLPISGGTLTGNLTVGNVSPEYVLDDTDSVVDGRKFKTTISAGSILFQRALADGVTYETIYSIDPSGNIIFTKTPNYAPSPTSGSHLTNKDYVDSAGVGVLGANGYAKFKINGTTDLIIQWGVITTASGSQVAVLFPTVFPTGCMSVTGSPDANNNSYNANDTFYGLTTTQFTLGNYTGVTAAYHWIAIGY